MPTCPTVDFGAQQGDTLPQAQSRGADLFIKHGCLLARNVFSPAYVAQLYDAYAENYQLYFQDRAFPDALRVGDKRTQITVDIKGPFNSPQLYANPCIFPVLKTLLSERMIVGSVGSVVSLPGAQDQHVHRDHPALFERPDVYAAGEAVIPWLPPYAITVVVPLVPLNAINGTTRVWPGSHLVRQSEARQLPYLDPVADVGDCLLMDYRLLHGGTANCSGNIRPILYNVYYRPWFRDTYNYSKQDPIQLSDDEYMRIPTEFRRLFDWQRQAARSYVPASAGIAAQGPATPLRRNESCFCGSGRRYKECHGRPG